jgi:hypothetical protein
VSHAANVYRLHSTTSMRIFLALALCLLSLPTQGRIRQDAKPDTECKGAIHGIVTGHDGNPLSRVGVIVEPDGGYGYVLPRTNTDEHGKYRFEKICTGRWRVFVKDEKAGYPRADRATNRFLYGHDSPTVQITDKQLEAEFNFSVPPKPGQLRVHVTSNGGETKFATLQIKLIMTRKRSMEVSCLQTLLSTCDDVSVVVPPDQDVRLHVNSKGFYEWEDSKGRGKLIHLSGGQLMTINVELRPVAN